jgi:hypothetical protein
MAAIAFDTLKFARRLIAAGVPEHQAEVHTEAMAEAFIFNIDSIVTKDYLDARIDAMQSHLEMKFEQRFAATEAKLRLLFWMQAITLTVVLIPTLTSLVAG